VGVEVEDAAGLVALAKWLDQGHYEQMVGNDEQFFVAELDAGELRTSEAF
jgi:hypothetical protein